MVLSLKKACKWYARGMVLNVGGKLHWLNFKGPPLPATKKIFPRGGATGALRRETHFPTLPELRQMGA
jgi:hypothetical protein